MSHVKWVVVKIENPELASEVLSSYLDELGAKGFTTDEKFFNAFFKAEIWTAETEELINSRFLSLVKDGIFSKNDIVIDRIDQEDWVGRWRRSLGPIRAGKHFVVVPPGVNFEPAEEDIPLYLEPRMAFGTGEHPTTKMALSLLEKTVKSGDRVIDMGCGNGILAIAALFLGAKSVYGIDNEEESVQETKENAESHKLGDKTTVVLDDVLNCEVPGMYDLLLANIFVNPIMQGFPNWEKHVKDNGRFIFTGVRAEEESPKLIEFMDSHGLKLVESLTQDGWFAARFDRP